MIIYYEDGLFKTRCTVCGEEVITRTRPSFTHRSCLPSKPNSPERIQKIKEGWKRRLEKERKLLEKK